MPKRIYVGQGQALRTRPCRPPGWQPVSWQDAYAHVRSTQSQGRLGRADLVGAGGLSGSRLVYLRSGGSARRSSSSSKNRGFQRLRSVRRVDGARIVSDALVGGLSPAVLAGRARRGTLAPPGDPRSLAAGNRLG